jgi:PAS domain S-box-containing protein
MIRNHSDNEFQRFMQRESALELARRSLLGAPVYTLISLIMLIGTPIYGHYGAWSLLEAIALIMMGAVRILFARSFEQRYDRLGEKAVLQFNLLTALQSLSLGVLAGVVLYLHWSTQEVVLTIVLSAGVVAASTSALSVRSSAHLIFMVCVLAPLGYGVLLAGGAAKAVIIVAYLSLMGFLVQDGGQARKNYLDKLRNFFSHQSELREREGELHKLGLALEQSQDSIMITNVDGDIEYVNEALLETTGFSREDLIGRNPRIKRSSLTPASVFEDMWVTISRGEPWKGELNSRRKDGTEYVEFVRIAPVKNERGDVTHFVALLEDVTEKRRVADELLRHRHHLEELVEQRTDELIRQHEQAETARHELQAAEAANRAKTAFLANMSHEIRTPMNAILGFTHLLLQDELAPKHRDRLLKIDSAAEHLLSTINDILDLTKIEAGKMELQEDNFSLGEMVNRVLELVRDDVERAGLTISFDQQDVPDHFRGDETRLRQALLNYVGNAVKFTRRGSIRIRALLLKERAGRQLIQFEVQDTGIGIDPERLNSLFNAFEQGDSSNTKRYGGTGLGLAITRHIVDMMGGNVGADSKPGAGSTFWFTAWLEMAQESDVLQKPPRRQEQAVSDIDPDHRGKRVLLVEDNRINREVARTLLRRCGLEVDVATNGLEAVEAVKARRYDLVLMDVQMPEMDGLEATGKIRELEESAFSANVAQLPILAMTAATFEDDREKCLQAGMDDFVAKPVNPRALLVTLNRWLETGVEVTD